MGMMDDQGLPLDKAPTTKTQFLCQSAEAEIVKRIQKHAMDAHNKLQFRDFSMYDIRLDQAGYPHILEANLFCSFGVQSVLVAHAEQIGLDDKELFRIMVNNALSRKR